MHADRIGRSEARTSAERRPAARARRVVRGQVDQAAATVLRCETSVRAAKEMEGVKSSDAQQLALALQEREGELATARARLGDAGAELQALRAQLRSAHEQAAVQVRRAALGLATRTARPARRGVSDQARVERGARAVVCTQASECQRLNKHLGARAAELGMLKARMEACSTALQASESALRAAKEDAERAAEDVRLAEQRVEEKAGEIAALRVRRTTTDSCTFEDARNGRGRNERGSSRSARLCRRSWS